MGSTVTKVKSKVGRIHIHDIRTRNDWSDVNSKLRALRPAQVVSFECPANVEVAKLRSAILTNAKRFHTGEYLVSTRTEGRTIHCFLARRIK